MERKLGLLLATTLAIVLALGWIIASEPGRVQSVEARAAEAGQGGEGATLYADNCAGCHGRYGEGTGDARNGPPPLSSREFLSTFDDATIRAVTAKGKPSRGMPGWSKQSGGALTEEQVNEIVVFVRNWQNNPPQIPPRPSPTATQPAKPSPTATPAPPPSPTSTLAPPTATREAGPSATPEAGPPPAVKEQAQPSPTAAEAPRPSPTAKKEEPTATPPPPAGVSFAKDILPVFQRSCAACHGTMGGYSASSYAGVVTTGDHKPAVVAGDADNSLLVQKLKGTSTTGTRMPPGANPLPDDVVQKIVEWIKAGAKDN